MDCKLLHSTSLKMGLPSKPTARLDYVSYYAGTTLLNLATALGLWQPFCMPTAYEVIWHEKKTTPTGKMVTKWTNLILPLRKVWVLKRNSIKSSWWGEQRLKNTQRSQGIRAQRWPRHRTWLHNLVEGPDKKRRIIIQYDKCCNSKTHRRLWEHIERILGRWLRMAFWRRQYE